MVARRVLPGFGLSMGITLVYLALVVLIPLSAVVVKTAGLTWDRFVDVVTSERAAAAYCLSLTASLVAAVVNAVFGVLVAWVLERYDFPGKRLVDGLVDLPFALPTAVAGISLAALWGPNGWLGRFAEGAGLRVVYTSTGVVVALIFVGLPFVVRTVQPVLRNLQTDVEEAAATLGAGRIRTMTRVLLPPLLPAVLTGFTLALARGLGEFGSVIFVAGNLPLESEIVPLLILIRLEEYDYAGATAIALVFLVISFGALAATNALARQAAARVLPSG